MGAWGCGGQVESRPDPPLADAEGSEGSEGSEGALASAGSRPPARGAHEPLAGAEDRPVFSAAPVDLSLTQALDALDFSDGDEAAFKRADHGLQLVYGRSASDSSLADRRGACNDDPRVLLGLVSLDTCIGAELFFREGFGGNGRTCSSCHPVANNFTLDPAFIATLPDSDPLFIAERDDALRELERPALMRGFGLILENVDGLESPSTKFVMRSVSHLFSMATSLEPGPILPEFGVTRDASTIPPLQRTGWGGDGAPGLGTLREFTSGAVEQHASRSLQRIEYVDFVPPTDNQLRLIEQFQLQLGRRTNFDILPVVLSDAAAQRGLESTVIGGAQLCDTCHRNAQGTNFEPDSPLGLANSNFDTGVERARPPILDQLQIPHDGGFGTDPLDADGDGTFEAFGDNQFNTQPLIEAADTGPFFHNNAVDTLEDAIRFYTSDTFANSEVGGRLAQRFTLTEPEVLDLGRFLRVLNAAFNCQLAAARLQAAFQIVGAFGNQHISVQRGLLELASVELDDAVQVLSLALDLNVESQRLLLKAKADIRRAQRTSYRGQREELTRAALIKVTEANAALGTGVDYEIGEGTLMF
jgi:hypothetical protein